MPWLLVLAHPTLAKRCVFKCVLYSHKHRAMQYFCVGLCLFCLCDYAFTTVVIVSQPPLLPCFFVLTPLARFSAFRMWRPYVVVDVHTSAWLLLCCMTGGAEVAQWAWQLLPKAEV